MLLTPNTFSFSTKRGHGHHHGGQPGDALAAALPAATSAHLYFIIMLSA
jgi:hypothetical protein